MRHETAPTLLLLLDRDESRASADAHALGQGGFEVCRATDLESARQALECELPEVVLVAEELVREGLLPAQLRAIEEALGLPLFVVVGSSDEPRALPPEADDWIERPLRPEVVQHRFETTRRRRDAELRVAQLSSNIDVLQSMGRMGVWGLSPQTGELFCTPASCALLGLPPTDQPLSPDRLLEGVHPESEREVRHWLEEVCNGNDVASVEYEILQRDGSPRRLKLRAHVRHQTGGQLFVDGIIQDCTPGLDPLEATELVNTNDALTGLPNRKQFLNTLDLAIQDAVVTGEQIAILFLEVNAMTADGSALAQDQREDLLIQVVQRLKVELRGFDVLGQSGADLALSRVGSETLTVLLREQSRSQDAFKISRRIRETTEQSFVVMGRDLMVNFNIGIAVYPGDAESPMGLVKCAEEAMYCAKQQGRNNIQFYTSAMNTATFETLTLESSLRRALERDELLVYYQPKIEIASNRIVGMEALVRWRHPELGLVSPAQFIPVAEETGLIIPIGEFVLRTACEQNKRWQEMGLDPIRMAVNLSSIQFRRPDLFDTVVGVLQDTRLDADWLELEITESILLKNVEATISTLHQLKRAGIHLSIDDFGTGYSSLSYLKRFPVDALKIDQSFIREVTANADDASITTSIILMGHSLKLKVIAEGVETKSQLSFLRVLECDEVQGYFFSAPVPADDATKLLEESVTRESA